MGSSTAGLALVLEGFIKERCKPFPCEFGYRLSSRLRESAESIQGRGMDPGRLRRGFARWLVGEAIFAAAFRGWGVPPGQKLDPTVSPDTRANRPRIHGKGRCSNRQPNPAAPPGASPMPAAGAGLPLGRVDGGRILHRDLRDVAAAG